MRQSSVAACPPPRLTNALAALDGDLVLDEPRAIGRHAEGRSLAVRISLRLADEIDCARV
jgi:hypothetical protein